jgi:uncharacterized membrane protein YhdT
MSGNSYRTLQSLTRNGTSTRVVTIDKNLLSKGRDRSSPNGLCFFRTKAKHIDNSHSLQRTNRVALFAKGLKLVRIPVLIISVYGLGYNQGVMDYARNPDKKRVSCRFLFALLFISQFSSLSSFFEYVL